MFFTANLQPGAPPLGRHPRPPRALSWVAGGRQLIKYVQHRCIAKLALFDHHGLPLLGGLTAYAFSQTELRKSGPLGGSLKSGGVPVAYPDDGWAEHSLSGSAERQLRLRGSRRSERVLPHGARSRWVSCVVAGTDRIRRDARKCLSDADGRPVQPARSRLCQSARHTGNRLFGRAPQARGCRSISAPLRRHGISEQNTPPNASNRCRTSTTTRFTSAPGTGAISRSRSAGIPLSQPK